MTRCWQRARKSARRLRCSSLRRVDLDFQHWSALVTGVRFHVRLPLPSVEQSRCTYCSALASGSAVSLSLPTIEASSRVYEPRFSLDDTSITSSTTEDVPETGSFIYNRSFASSDTRIASYKTVKTFNSRKSRYNTLPRHKYAGIGSTRRPQGLMSFDVDLPEVCSPLVIGIGIPTLASLFKPN